MPDINYEVKYKTARSGGKGGQNVNKVETMVEAYWHVENSAIYSAEEKQRIIEKLATKINADGYLVVKSQKERSQLANKEDAVKKMTAFIEQALHIAKKRKPTRVSRAAKERRLQGKQKKSEVKEQRRKPVL